MSGFKTAKAVLGRRVLATTAALALATAGVLVGTSSAEAASAQTGGTLYFITHAEQFDHVDPARVYTGRDIAFFNSYLYRNLVAYKPVAGAAGSSLVGDLATNTGVPSNTLRHGSSHFVQALHGKMVQQSHVLTLHMAFHVHSHKM